MCRHAMLNKQGVNLIDKEYRGIENFLNFLVIERGGNGNGLALVKDNKLVFFKKGLDYTTLDIANTLRTMDFDYAFFHTRLATIGTINDGNCHPFVFSDKFLMSMNGTEDEYSNTSFDDIHFDMTDAERVARAFYESGKTPEEFLLSGDLGSCFCGFYDGKAFVASNSKNLLRVLKKDDALVLASDFPWRYDGKNIYDLTTSFYWDEEKGLPDTLKEAKHGRENLVDAVTRQLLNKTSDTLLTLVSQASGISENDLYTYPLKDILYLAHEYGVIKDDVNGKHIK